MYVVADISVELAKIGQDVINLDIDAEKTTIQAEIARIVKNLHELEDFILNSVEI